MTKKNMWLNSFLSGSHDDVGDVSALFLARLISLLPPKIYLKILKRLEVGVFFFCWRASIEARKQGLLTLEQELIKQADSEYDHAQALAILAGSKLNISSSGMLDREAKGAHLWGTIAWEKNDQYQADGISKRWISARIFFGFRQANSYDWKDKLAFMCVLETFQHEFYVYLRQFISPDFHSIIDDIIDDELKHSHDLAISLNEIAPKDCDQIIRKWERRKDLALLFVPADLLLFLIRH